MDGVEFTLKDYKGHFNGWKIKDLTQVSNELVNSYFRPLSED
jgi:hypothetical protein